MAIWSFLFAALSGCGIAFLGVLQEGTANDADSTIWQFYWSETQESEQAAAVLFLHGSMAEDCARRFG